MDERRDIDRGSAGTSDSARLEADVDRVQHVNDDMHHVSGERRSRDPEDSREWAVPGNDRTTSERKREPREIERDIERTRAEMTETINEIEERLSPQHLKAQLKDTVHETIDSVQGRFSPQRMKYSMQRKARRTGENMLESVKENPLPAVLTALGLAWWMRSANEHGGNDFRTSYARRYPDGRRGRYRDEFYGDDYYGYRRPGYGDAYIEEDIYYGATGEPMYYEESVRYETDYRQPRSGQSRTDQMTHKADDMAYRAGSKTSDLQHKASDLQHKAGDKAHELQDRASDAVHEVKDRASHAAHEAQYQARRAGRQVQYGARRATNWMDDMMHRNPVTAGAIALGIGAAIGAALPHTRQEDEWVGEYRDDLVHRAEDMGHEYADKARHVAERTAEEVKQSVKDVAESTKETVKQEAKKEMNDGSGSSGSSMSGGASISGGSAGSMGSTSAGSAGGSATVRTTETTGSNYSGTASGKTAAGTGPIGGTHGPTGLDKANSGVGPQADRNKPGSNL